MKFAMPFNRTSMELKQMCVQCEKEVERTFNRTSMELKPIK